MKIKCYDKYHNHHLIIDFDDEIDIDGFSSRWAGGKLYLNFELDNDYYKKHLEESAEDPGPKRWSDLTKFEII